MDISKSNFDVTNPAVAIRLMCGLAYIPHILFKLNDLAGTMAFFSKIGLNPAGVFVMMAIASEAVCVFGLALGILVKWVGFLSAGLMMVAAYTVFVTKGAVWLWNLGGVEYITVLGVSSLVLAIHAWKQEFSAHGRLSLLVPRVSA
jgi:putative oxidoreductase